MSQPATKEGKISHKIAILTTIKEFLMTKRAAQSHQVGHMRPAGFMFETLVAAREKDKLGVSETEKTVKTMSECH